MISAPMEAAIAFIPGLAKPKPNIRQVATSSLTAVRRLASCRVASITLKAPDNPEGVNYDGECRQHDGQAHRAAALRFVPHGWFAMLCHFSLAHAAFDGRGLGRRRKTVVGRR